MLPPGTHRFPFKFKLHGGIPSSAHLSSHSVKVHVKYQIKAIVSDDKGKAPPIKYKSAFLVTELPRAPPTTRKSAVLQYKGCVYSAILDKDAFLCGENA
jgi:Arrestin (or S-antigen), N-terminal domain